MSLDAEPLIVHWDRMSHPDLLRALMQLPGRGRPSLIGIDGRSGSGKSTLAANLAKEAPDIAVIHTDDIAWHQSFFGWDQLMVDGLLKPLRDLGPPVSCRPPAWDNHRRAGDIYIPPHCRGVIVEGVGACRQRLHEWYDASVWVQTDADLAYHRVVDRNSDPLEFTDDWTAAEIPFLAADRPWERVSIIASGQLMAPNADEVCTHMRIR